MTQTWRVGAIMREPLEVVARFINWYKRLGADEIVIFFDDPEDAALTDFTTEINAIACPPEFWDGLGRKPDAPFVKRQNAALTWLYQQYTDGWLLNVDADEYLWPGSGEVAGLLSHAMPETISLRVRTAEQVAGTSKTAFRLPMDRAVLQYVYQDDAPLFGPRREGFVGHSAGKSLIRCGERPLKLRQHWPERPSGKRPPEVVLDSRDGAYLLHMIGADYEIWRDKVAWRSASAGFTEALTARIAEALKGPDAHLYDLFQRLHSVTDAQAARMAERGVLLQLDPACFASKPR